MLAAIVAMLIQAAPATAAEPILARTARLYDQLCLKAFPDDGALAAALHKLGAEPLTSEQVKVTLRDDPGRGWSLKDGDTTVLVILELPPYHACSVRWPDQADYDLAPYQEIATPFLAAHPGFEEMPPYDADVEDLHIHAVGRQKTSADGSSESLLVFEQKITDPKRRAKGEDGRMLRFVHQIKVAD